MTLNQLLEEKTEFLKELGDEILNISPNEDIEEEIIQGDKFLDITTETQKAIVRYGKGVANSSTAENEATNVG